MLGHEDNIYFIRPDSGAAPTSLFIARSVVAGGSFSSTVRRVCGGLGIQETPLAGGRGKGRN